MRSVMQLPTDPDVTVLMPVHNGGHYLDAAIDSIRGQQLRNFEFIICDDGSTDDTPDLLAQHAAQDARIKVLTLPPVGLVQALNRGMKAARTAWVARMDADDVAWPDRLSVQMAAAAAHPEAGGIGSAWRIIDRDDRPRQIVRPPTDPAAIATGLLERNCLAHPTMLLRRAAVMAAGLYRDTFRYAEDYDLWLRLSEHHKLYAVPQPLLDYREHPGQISQGALEQRILAELGAQVAARARRQGAPDPAAGAPPVTREWLLSAGVGEADIRARLVAGALGAAKNALRARQPAAARAAVRLLGAQEGLHPRTRLHALMLQVKAGFMREQARPP
jgi:Glycosyl transferase family 2